MEKLMMVFLLFALGYILIRLRYGSGKRFWTLCKNKVVNFVRKQLKIAVRQYHDKDNKYFEVPETIKSRPLREMERRYYDKD